MELMVKGVVNMKRSFILFISIFFSIIFLSQQNFLFAQDLDYRARGYSLANSLKTTFLNNGKIGNGHPGGYYRDLQYFGGCSFVLGINGKDENGDSCAWAVGRKWLYDRFSDTYKWYGTDSSFWGPTVSESWMDRTSGFHISDWEAESDSHIRLFGDQTAYQIAPDWTSSDDTYPVLAHSNHPATFPAGGWPGFWGWDENGQLSVGQFFSDEDIYYEMDDRFPNRDVYPEGVLPGYPTDIKVKSMASSFEFIPGGFIIFRYRLINQSPHHYKDIYSGFYFDADIYSRLGNGSYYGRTNDDDMMRFNLENQSAYIWDLDGQSGSYHGDDLACVGITLIETPPSSREIDLNADGITDIFPGEPTGISGWHWFDWYFRPGARDIPNQAYSGDGVTPCSEDREEIQYKLMAGDTSNLSAYNAFHYFHPPSTGSGHGPLNPRFDSSQGVLNDYPNGLDAVFILSNGPFELQPGDTTEIVMALVAAVDSSMLVHQARMARSLYKSKYAHNKINVVDGNGGEIFSGSATVSWNVDASYPHPVNNVDLYLSKEYECEWRPLAIDIPNTGSFSFNTSDWDDGAFYSFLVVSHNDENFVYGFSDDFFTINNPGNAAPELVVFQPAKYDSLSGISNVKWLAKDADGDSLFITVKIQINSSETIISNGQYTEETGNLNVDWDNFPSGSGELIITLKDIYGEFDKVLIDPIYISNSEAVTLNDIFEHVSGKGRGELQVKIHDCLQLTDHTYQITFTSGDTAEYAKIVDLNTNECKAENIEYINKYGSAIFDGISLLITGYLPPIIDSTYWKIGNSTSSFINVGSNGEGNPADYEIVFDTLGVDTSTTGLPLPFQVFNKTFAPDSAVDVWLIDTAPIIGEFDDGDIIYLKEAIIAGVKLTVPIITYHLTYSCDSSDTPVESKDIYRFTTLRYYSEDDTILFQIPEEYQSIEDLNKFVLRTPTLKQNYPNPFNPTTTISFYLPYRELVKLTIYDILGRKTAALVNDQLQPGNYEFCWDGRNDSGNRVSSGIYFFKFEAGKFVKTRKMILIR